ncbi:MAG: haloacid dehalogenase [Bacteroidetes bacterium HGW-Bacteroidetes-22]|nr:MAG: haloacid dehalogenase [Bacteroidetes bacterium HGW-Bacteroidetes-22]
MKKITRWIYPYILLALPLFICSCNETNNHSKNEAAVATDTLPSWNNTPAKKAIIAFVEQVTSANSPDFVLPAERIATFDNDGTLWAEQPLAFQLFFIFDRIKALAPQHPEWKTKEPFASLLRGDNNSAIPASINSFAEMGELILVTQADISPEEYEQIVADWITVARHPVTGKPLTSMVYQPMLELLNYLRANDFKIYIVSGGSCDFMRAFAEKTYGVVPEQVIGSSLKTRFEMNNERAVITNTEEFSAIITGKAKPLAIQSVIGRRPIASFGNSDNDLPMMQWTASGKGAHLCLYVHHTDSVREYAYDRVSADPFDKGLDEAMAKGWIITDMKTDWKTVYPPEKK